MYQVRAIKATNQNTTPISKHGDLKVAIAEASALYEHYKYLKQVVYEIVCVIVETEDGKVVYRCGPI